MFKLNVPANKQFKMDARFLKKQILEITDKLEDVLPGDDLYQLIFSEQPADEEMRTLKLTLSEQSADDHVAFARKTENKSAEELVTYLENKKRELIKKKYDDLSELEKKILFDIPLTEDELASLK